VSDGKIIKECLEAVTDVTLPNKKHINSKISLSRFSFGGRIEEFLTNKEESLKTKFANFQCLL